jgi:hypothetical protein
MWKPVTFQQRQELECFHFQAQAPINHQQHNVSNFGQINHCPDIVVALDDGDALFFVRTQCDCTFYFIYFLLCVMFA